MATDDVSPAAQVANLTGCEEAGAAGPIGRNKEVTPPAETLQFFRDAVVSAAVAIVESQ